MEASQAPTKYRKAGDVVDQKKPETPVILDHIPSRKKWEVQYPWSQLALGQHPLRKLLPPGSYLLMVLRN